jgi:hypothetical protein
MSSADVRAGASPKLSIRLGSGECEETGPLGHERKVHIMSINTAITALAVAFAGSATAQNLASNGGFETGDTSGWEYFPTAESNFGVNGDANSGMFGGELFNINTGTGPAGALIKQANIGIGVVNAGDEIEIKFAAKGDFLVGGVGIVEFFSEIDGGGTSSAEILGGAPLFLASESDYQEFTFTTFAGPDVSGGVTLQFVAATGGATGSLARFAIDDVSVRVIPTPATAGLLGLGGLASLRRRR